MRESRAMAASVRDVDTERLTLRVPRLEDFEDAFAMWSNADVVRHISGKPSTREEMWARLLRYVGHWELLGYGFWTVREKSSGRFVGEVGVGQFRRDLQPPLGDDKEAGWVLAPWCHGKGYATEAMQAALAWNHAQFGAERFVCLIAPQNLTSVRVASKLAFREFGRVTYKGEESLVLERPPARR